jgi:hypothetical protein
MQNESLPTSAKSAAFIKFTIGMLLGLCAILLMMSGIELWANREGLPTNTLKSAISTIILFSALIYNPIFWNQTTAKPKLKWLDNALILIFVTIFALTWINFSFIQTVAWSWLVLVISAVYLFRTIQRLRQKA